LAFLFSFFLLSAAIFFVVSTKFHQEPCSNKKVFARQSGLLNEPFLFPKVSDGNFNISFVALQPITIQKQ